VIPKSFSEREAASGKPISVYQFPVSSAASRAAPDFEDHWSPALRICTSLASGVVGVDRLVVEFLDHIVHLETGFLPPASWG